MQRAHVIRLNPIPEQEVYFRKACGVARHAYNWALAQWKAARAEGKRVSMHDLKRQYNQIKKEQFPWTSEVTKCSPEQAFADLGAAFTNYWRMKKEGTQPKLKHPRKDGEEAGFPHFKSKKRDRLSFYLANDKFSVQGYTLRVPKLGKVNISEPLRFEGKILNGVISYRAGWWFVSITVEVQVEDESPSHRGGTVGIDLGVKTLATLSSGEKYENQRHYRRNLRRIKGLSKGLSRKAQGSQNWWKASRKLAKAHYRVACQRRDTLHRMTTHVARTYGLIGLEDLNVKGMMANHHLAQAVSDASFFEVKRQLLYKAQQHGGYVQLVDRWFPSSKTCHVCGWVKPDLTLAERVWTCEQCRTAHDRDLNAAIMVETEALRLMTGVPGVASSARKLACGAGSAGLLATEGETACAEAGTGRW
ncbi:MAG TPA: RNA-guided endonuclease TnpB family protein [Ktedonobacteraceae bacterium]|nr:RNA-guided endonuclease TnpB family protein [Ktedonobacteraceae bacterium]